MQNTNIPQEWNQFLLKDVSFVNLMTRRIFNVLIVANPYDAFMLEDDGRVDEKLFDEYMQLGLRYPPTFTQVSTIDEANAALRSTDIDLVICMPGTEDRSVFGHQQVTGDAFDVARQVKATAPQIPCVVLTPFSHGITRRMEHEDLSGFDYVFCWLGNTNLILSIIKLLEDRMNIDHDIREAGVQVIMLVEDSIRFYSSILPNLYNYILAQCKNFSTEALNPHAAAQRKRGRPKVVLARNYEEAWQLYQRYHDNILGVISDTRYPLENSGSLGEPGGLGGDPEAGLKLLKAIRQQDEYVPLVLQSSESANRAKAEAAHFHFIDKNSKSVELDLRQLLEEHFGFGDFVFRDPLTKREVARVRTLKELQDQIFTIPDDSMLYHVSRNHTSRWLSARAIFPVSQFLKNVTWHRLQDVQAHRQIIFDAIVQYRRMKNIGIVAVFDRGKFDKYAHFARIGDGSLGGKGRGLAFIDNILKRHPETDQLEGASVQIPKTVVLCTDFFDQFMDHNHLYPLALSDAPDEQILEAFLKAQLPDSLIADFFTFFDAVKRPIAVRSSSLLEDSHYQPFAGVYATYMVPYLDDRYEMLRQLAQSIKAVYASVFYKDSKAYMTATSNVIDQEKMAVILQEVVGRQYGDHFYPTFSGVLRSLNYYPIGDEKADEGIASLALGLGKYIVDGGQTLRVSPYHPTQVLQTSEMETALRDTQTRFYALDMNALAGRDIKTDDGFNIKRLRVKQADQDGALMGIASTYDPTDQVIRPGLYEGGRKVITFDGVLGAGGFPLPELLQMVQRLGADEMKRPVEIEFAANLNGDGTGDFYLLQIRPIVETGQTLDVSLETIPDERCLLRSANSLGHGINEEVTDVVYVKAPLAPADDTDKAPAGGSTAPGAAYSASDNPAIATEIEAINRHYLETGQGYILIGPGRWGSSDPWLGIPVKWPHISAARLITEVGLQGYHVDPSQGTHFFQNLTSFGVGYFTISPYLGQGLLRQDLLDSMPAVEETPHVRVVRFARPLRIMMDGQKQQGVVEFGAGD